MGNHRSKPFYIFTALIALFIVPLIFAWWLVSHRDGIGSGTTNHGNLINPPLQFSQLKFNEQTPAIKTIQGKWALIYINPGKTCDTLCKQNLDNMSRIRRATGKEVGRVQLVLINLNPISRHKFPILTELSTRKSNVKHFLDDSPGEAQTLKQGGLYLADPNGNVMLRYAANANPNNVYKDLKKLLKVSQIG